MNKEQLLNEWLEEEKVAHIHGWDFSHIHGKYEEENDLPWDYSKIIRHYLLPEMKLLDIDTGGGEFLLSLKHPLCHLSATEAYSPNVELCKEKLLPLGVDFREADGLTKLPFNNETFDIVINRHGAFNENEIWRVLKPKGIFITQQVGAENDRELVELLLNEIPPLPFPKQYLHKVQQAFEKKGFTTLEAEEVYRPIKFWNVGALVWFAHIIEWEFPNFDVGQRSAASIARRLEDPLAELVKIDPKAIGVGQYQHDMNQKKLTSALDAVVEDCVNKVGVDLNTASAPLMEHISGINKTLAKNIVEYRETNGRFTSRKELLKVPKLGPKAFLQCAGFMRINDGKNPLDSTSVHPESYDIATALIKETGHSLEELKSGSIKNIRKSIADVKKLAEKLGTGAITLTDIINELEKPARDPRDEMPKPILRGDVLEMKDLTEGMVLKGTVRNVIDFGAFVDIGVHQDGLVHISQMSDKYIKHPMEVVNVGDIVTVKVMSVDLNKKRIQLTMKGIQ